jgi:hypothetical protein
VLSSCDLFIGPILAHLVVWWTADVASNKILEHDYRKTYSSIGYFWIFDSGSRLDDESNKILEHDYPKTYSSIGYFWILECHRCLTGQLNKILEHNRCIWFIHRLYTFESSTLIDAWLVNWIKYLNIIMVRLIHLLDTFESSTLMDAWLVSRIEYLIIIIVRCIPIRRFLLISCVFHDYF